MQWAHFRRAYAMMASFIIPLMVLVSSIVGWDFAISVMHGLHSAVFAPLFVLGALYSGVAAVIALAIGLRKYFHFEDYIKIEYLEKLAIFLFVLCLVWIYIMASETFIFWQSEDLVESALIASKMTGEFAGMYWFMIAVLAVLPFSLLVKRIRTSTRHLFVISLLVIVGMWLERYLLMVPSLVISDVPFSWGSYFPSVVEISIIAGTFAFFALNFLLFIKLFPVVSLYEIKETLALQKKEVG